MDNPIVEGLRRARIAEDPDVVTVPDLDAEMAELSQQIVRLSTPADLAARADVARRIIAVGLGAGRDDVELLGRSHLMDVLAVTGERGHLLDELAVYDQLARASNGDAKARAEMLLAAQALIDGRFAESAAHVAAAVAGATPGSDIAYLEPIMGFALARMTGDGLHEFVPRIESIVSRLPFAARGWLALAHMAVGDRPATAKLWESLRPYATQMPLTATEFLVAGVGNAELAAWLGDTATADALCELLLPHSGLHVMGSAAGPYEGPVDLALGRLARTLGRRELAREHLEEALIQCRNLHALPYEAIVLAELRTIDAPGTRARIDKIEAARAIAQRLGMVPLERILAEQVPAGNPTLTAREQEIASLIAGGCTNADIARQLFLSERTVENHIRNALIKIDGASRTALAVWHVSAQTGG